MKTPSFQSTCQVQPDPAIRSCIGVLSCLLAVHVIAQESVSELRKPLLTVEQLRAQWTNANPAHLKTAAEAGNPEAQFLHGLSVMQGDREAIGRGQRWVSAAVFANNDNFTEAQLTSFREQWGRASEGELLAAATNGVLGAQWYYGQSLMEQARAKAGKGIEWITQAAAQGLASAQFELGMLYLRRQRPATVPLDPATGLIWLERAADQGFEPAIHQKSDILLEGQPSAAQLDEVVRLLREAAAKGCARANYELGILYGDGVGEPRSADETPVALFRKAAAAGYARAFEILGDRYRTGLGVERNYLRAIQWYEQAIENKVDFRWEGESAAWETRNLLDERLWPKPDLGPELSGFATILSLHERALRKNDASAAYQLGSMCLAGHALPEDETEAFVWFSIAADIGHLQAAAERDRLKPSLSSEEQHDTEQRLLRLQRQRGGP